MESSVVERRVVYLNFFSFFIGMFFDGSSLFTVESNPCLSSIV